MSKQSFGIRLLPVLLLMAALAALLAPARTGAANDDQLSPRRWVGMADLRQRDSESPKLKEWGLGGIVKCQDFSTSPLMAGTIELTHDLHAETVQGRFDLSGGGTRVKNVCGDRTYKINYSATASATLSGKKEDNLYALEGEMIASRSVSFVECTRRGQPITCPEFKQLASRPLYVTTNATLNYRGEQSGFGELRFTGNVFDTTGVWSALDCSTHPDCEAQAQAKIPAWRNQLDCPGRVPPSWESCKPGGSLVPLNSAGEFAGLGFDLGQQTESIDVPDSDPLARWATDRDD